MKCQFIIIVHIYKNSHMVNPSRPPLSEKHSCYHFFYKNPNCLHVWKRSIVQQLTIYNQIFTLVKNFHMTNSNQKWLIALRGKIFAFIVRPNGWMMCNSCNPSTLMMNLYGSPLQTLNIQDIFTKRLLIGHDCTSFTLRW